MASTTRVFRHAPYTTISPTAQANDQTGRTVLITGAGRGIGYAIAQAYIQANASQVILTGIRQETLDRAALNLAGSSTETIIKSYVCDLNNETSVEHLWQRLHSDQISVDVLVLNAADSASGPANPVGPFLSKLRAAFNVNFFGNTSMAARFLESFTAKIDSAPKAIVNISSFMAHSNPAPYQAAYSTSKAAFAHTLQLLAGEISTDECQIINVHPGAILTESVKNAPKEMLDTVVWDEGKMSKPAASSRLCY